MIRKLILLSSLFIISFLISCAQQVPPSGGPDDLTPPDLMESLPGLGATSVPKDVTFQFMFSEWINPASAKRSVTVYPPIEAGLRIRVSGRTLTIDPKEDLSDSTTYHVTLTTALEDLHGNNLGTAIDLYFSTGPRLDSGMVYGCIPTNSGYAQKPTVALYRTDTIPQDSLLFMDPTYVTQTDSFGVYELTHIRPSSYYLLAFLDKNNDNRLSPQGNEEAFTYVEPGIRVDSTAGPFILFPSTVDTSAVEIVSLRTHNSRVLRVEWSEKPFFSPETLDTIWHIDAADTTVESLPSIQSIIPVGEGRNAYLVLDRSMDLIPYRLIYPAASRTDSVMFFADSIRFNGTTVSDTIAPRFLKSLPDKSSRLDPQVRLIFSEPVRFLTDTIFLTTGTDGDTAEPEDTLGQRDTAGIQDEAAAQDTVSAKDTMELTSSTFAVPIDTAGWADTISFTVGRLEPGKTYRGSIPISLIEDIAGNNPSDTADTIAPETVDFSFTTVSIDDICLKLRGGAPCLEPDTSRIWIFRPLRGNEEFFSRDSSGLFTFDSIPAGEGTLAYFLDRNGDGRHTEGRLFPRLAPEPYFTFSDTIEARALWEIEGVRVDACRVCPPPGYTPGENRRAPGDTLVPQDTVGARSSPQR